MCGTTDSSFQSSNTLNNTGIWSLIELASLYTVPLSAINGLSRLTTTSNVQPQPIRKFSNRHITFESNRNGRFKFESNLEALQVPRLKLDTEMMIPVMMVVVVVLVSSSPSDHLQASSHY